MSINRSDLAPLILKPSAAQPAPLPPGARADDHFPSVNLKALGWLVAVLTILAGGTVAIHAYQVSRNTGLLKRQAERAVEEERFADAARYYELYLRYNPSDRKARLGLADALNRKMDRSLQDEKKVLDIYEAILRDNPDDDEVRRKLVEADIALKRFADALIHLKLLLEKYRDDGPLEQLTAHCHAAKNQNQAESFYQKALKHAPQYRVAYTELAELYQHMDKPRDADKVMEDLIQQNPNDYQAYLDRARYFRRSGSPDKAERDTRKAFQLAPAKLESLLAMAELAYLKKKYDEARGFLQKGLSSFPDSPSLYLVLAHVEMTDKHADRALDCLRRGLNAVPARGRNLLLHQLGMYLIQDGKQEQVASVLRELERGRASPAVIADLRALLLIAEENWRAGAYLLEKLLPQVASDPEAATQINLLLGLCYDKLAEPDQALAAYRRALADNPELLRARLGVPAALAALQRFDEAIVGYQALLAEEPSVGTMLAKLLVLRNLRLESVSDEDWRQVEKAWQVTAKADPHSPEVPLVRAQAWMARNEPEEARKVLEEACKEHPANAELWLALADTIELRGNFEEGLAVLQRAQEGHVGDCVNIRLARARYWTRQKTRSQKEVAAALARLEEGLEPFKNEERIRLYRGLADIHFRWGHLQDARRLWRQAALLAPRDLSVRLPLFDLAVQSGTFQEAEETVKEIRAIEGDEGTLWRFARASLILASAQQGKIENLQYARQLFNEVAARRNNWAPSMRALAALDDLEGNKPEALKRYALAFDLGDRDPDALRRAIQLMYDRRQYEDADRLLKKLEEQGRLPPFDLALLASLRSQQGKHSNAIDLAREAIRGGSKKPEDYIWLGQILWAAGDKYYEEAEDAFRQATRLVGTGQAPDSWVALVHFLNATRQIKKATAALEEAKRALPMPSAALALARCCEIVGQDEEAAAYLNEAAARNSSDFDTVRSIATFHLRRHDFAGAAPYFARLLDPNLKIDEQDRLWARCFLAVCQAHAGNFQSFEQVRHFLRQYLERSGDSPDNQRLLALLLSAHPHYRREGIHILEDLRTRGLLPAEDLVELGKLYEAVGDWSRARALYASQAKAELESAPKTYPRVTQYILALVRHDSREEASYWLEPLLQRAPASLQTLDAHVKVLKAQGKSALARGIIDKYQQRPDAELTTAALLYEEIGQPAAAEQAYRKLAGRPPAGRGQLILAEFLGRQGRTDEALDLCEQAARDGWLYQAAIMAPTVLQTANPTLAAPQFQRVEKVVESALGKYPGVAPALLERLASLQNLQGNFAQAENIYQKILQSSAPDAIVMNNLAFLLAYRSNRAAEALSLINRAIESTGELPELLDTRALIYLCLHRPEQALADLSAAIQDSPSATLYFHLAQVERLKDRSAAGASLKKAHELKLQRAALHPLERSAYDELLKSLGS